MSAIRRVLRDDAKLTTDDSSAATNNTLAVDASTIRAIAMRDFTDALSHVTPSSQRGAQVHITTTVVYFHHATFTES